MEAVKTLTKAYDFVTLPVYRKFGRAQACKKEQIQAIRSNNNDAWTRVDNGNHREAFEEFESIAHLTLQSNEKFSKKNVFGYRNLLKKEKALGKNYFMKQLAPEYTWINHREMKQRVDQLIRGLIGIGIKPNDNVSVFMETRLEWILLTEALFRMNTTVATLYATLGEEGIVHGINEVNSTHIITSNELLPKLLSLKSQLPVLKKVVVVRDTINGQLENLTVKKIDGCDMILMEDLESESFSFIDIEAVKMPTSKDVAVIMYTSGSTGIPKGVILTHGNLMTTFRAWGAVFAAHDFADGACHLAYLPLAHIFELLMCHVMLAMGHRIGFGSPGTVLETSPALMSNSLPDVQVLKPEIMAAVPLMLDRVRKTVEAKFLKRGQFARNLFDYALEYKMNWNNSGYKTPIIDKLLMKKIRQQFGGRLKIVCAGGAQLAPETQTFTQNTLSVSVIVVYGATESAAAGTLMNYGDNEVGTVGPPQYGTEIKLESWVEGGYLTTDLPNPRGEVVIKSKGVSRGYYNRDDLTEEAFDQDADGNYWFKTGDIGEFQPNGCLKIIDRKKFLVKLQLGEYVSPGRVEAELKCCPIVDNMCLFADANKNHTVAIVIPNESALQLMTGTNESLEDLCNDARVTELALHQITNWGVRAKLEKFEIPRRIKLVAETWTPDSGLVTAALKIRRQQVKDFYKDAIDELFSH